VLRGLPKLLAARMLFDYAWVSVARRIRPRPDDSFEAWGLKRFGSTLYHLCFGQYTERVWGVPPSRLSAKLASEKLSRLNLRDILHKLIGGRGEEQKTYWTEFLYPDRGMGVLFEALRDAVVRAGGRVHLSTPARALRLRGGRVAAVEAEGPAGRVTVEADWVLSTIPVGTLARAVDPPLDESVRTAAERLRFRSLLLVNLALDRPQAMPQHWVYLLDPRFRCNRVAEQKNLGKLCAPPDRTALAFELCCDEGDEFWRTPDEALFRQPSRMASAATTQNNPQFREFAASPRPAQQEHPRDEVAPLAAHRPPTPLDEAQQQEERERDVRQRGDGSAPVVQVAPAGREAPHQQPCGCSRPFAPQGAVEREQHQPRDAGVERQEPQGEMPRRRLPPPQGFLLPDQERPDRPPETQHPDDHETGNGVVRAARGTLRLDDARERDACVRPTLEKLPDVVERGNTLGDGPAQMSHRMPFSARNRLCRATKPGTSSGDSGGGSRRT